MTVGGASPRLTVRVSVAVEIVPPPVAARGFVAGGGGAAAGIGSAPDAELETRVTCVVPCPVTTWVPAAGAGGFDVAGPVGGPSVIVGFVWPGRDGAVPVNDACPELTTTPGALAIAPFLSSSRPLSSTV